ncbi:MAG: outer membrane beta-barrel protein [Bacteroidales bacterium]|nr:outer membrane beta-barrel protein [Bacteroidales bacterium]
MNRATLKDKLVNYRVDPPEKVWEGISGQIHDGRNRKRIYILLLASAASIALVVTLGIHYFSPDLPREDSLISETDAEGPAGPDKPTNLEQKVVEALAAFPEDSALPAARQIAMARDEAGETPVKAGREMETLTEAASGRPAEQEAEPEIRVKAATVSPSEPEPVKHPGMDPLPDSVPDLQQDPFPVSVPERKRDPRWMLGASLSPLYSFRDAEAGVVPDNPAETGVLSYSTGVHISYRRNSRLAFETGIYYNRTGIAIGATGIQVFNQIYDEMFFGNGTEQADIKTVSNSVGNIVAYSGDIYMNGYKINAENNSAAYSNGVLSQAEASEAGIRQHLDYLEVPFNLRYSLIDRTIELQLVGGMSTNILVGNYVTMETAAGREEIGYLSNVNTFNYSGNAGLGMIYHLGGKLSLMVEPRFRYFINSINDATLPSTRPYSLGLYTGLSYTF